MKDSAILAKSGEPAFRREWVQRLRDHGGRAPGEGGLELWLRLAETVGLAREKVASLDRVLPDVRRACDAYVRSRITQALRDARFGLGFVIKHAKTRAVPRVWNLIAELTCRCPMRCPHCSNPAAVAAIREALSAEAWGRVFREASALGAVHVGLTGNYIQLADKIDYVNS